MCLSRKFTLAGLVGLGLLTGFLPFAVPEACAQALREGLALCGGPLLLSLFPFLIVSALLIRCGAGGALGLALRPAARAIGVRAECAGGILLVGLLGGFAPAASAVAEGVRSGQLDPDEAAALLPACICSGPSFVVLTVGGQLLGSTALGIRLFLAQLLAGYLAAALLCRLNKKKRGAAPTAASRPAPGLPMPRLDGVIADAAVTYLKLCGFVLYFRLLAGGLGALLPASWAAVPAMLLEVCSGCDLASRSGRWASMLCCAALSLQGLSVLLQVRTICPEEVSFRPLLLARLIHLPLSLALFHFLLPQGAAEAFNTLCDRVVTMRRVPTDCALLVLLGCCFVACELCQAVPERKTIDADGSA